jgi:hypothetical protein
LVKDPSTVSYWMKKYGLASPYRDKHAAKGGIQREQLEPLVEEGMTIAEIANEVGLSKGTVRHRMGKYSLRTHNPARRRCREVARAGKAAGLLTVTMFVATIARPSSTWRGGVITVANNAARRRSAEGAGE